MQLEELHEYRNQVWANTEGKKRKEKEKIGPPSFGKNNIYRENNGNSIHQIHPFEQ